MNLFALPAILVGSLAFVFGSIVGSFLNVVALRWDSDRGLGRTNRSRCPHCQKQLAWYELIPVVSFLLQIGRCRQCHALILHRYLLVELGTGLIFALLAVQYGLTVIGLILIVLSCLLIVSLLIDLERFVLPDGLTVAVAALTVVGLLFARPNLSHLGDPSIWNQPFVGAALGLLVIGGLYVITKGKGMGLGDVKLAPVLGLGLGGVGSVVGLAASFLIGAVVGLVLIASGKAKLKTAVPFGPFLILGWWIALLWGPQIVTWYTGIN